MDFRNIKITCMAAMLCLTCGTQAKQYYGSFFGMKSDGTTANTGSLQRAIDYISAESPGDTLTLWVGRYLTGSVELKSNVTICLREGAILVGSPSAHDYNGTDGRKALLWADGKENINIYGLGVIEGQGQSVLGQIKAQRDKGYISESVAEASPSLLLFDNCGNVAVKGVILQNPCADALAVRHCSDIKADSLTVFGEAVDGSRGIVLDGNKNIAVSNCYVRTSGAPIKSSANVGLKTENCKF